METRSRQRYWTDVRYIQCVSRTFPFSLVCLHSLFIARFIHINVTTTLPSYHPSSHWTSPRDTVRRNIELMSMDKVSAVSAEIFKQIQYVMDVTTVVDVYQRPMKDETSEGDCADM